MMKVLYIVKSELHFYPPCVSQIRMLKEAHVDIEVLFGSCNESALTIFREEGIPYKELGERRGVLRGKLDKLNNWLNFRRSLKNELKKRDLLNTILWFGNAETVLPMKGLLRKYNYAISFLELLDDHPFRLKMLESIAINAHFNVMCEETRAYLLRAKWNLSELPYVIPNKPFDNPNRFLEITNQQAKDLLSSLSGKKILILQGYIEEYEVLKNFAEALNELSDEYRLLLMGPENPKVIEPLKSLSSKIVYSKYIPAPQHLQVTRRAYIGIVYYNGFVSLNNAFCAPNKIYEYSAFGLPMLANNIPGLKNTVGACGAAVCCELTKSNIITAINKIEQYYDTMRTASIDFYEATDCRDIINTIISKKIK